MKSRWLRELWHPSEDALLLYMDGELGPLRRRRVAAHLRNCWACRSRRDRIAEAVAAVVDCVNAEEVFDTPPRAWRTFQPGLHALAAQPQWTNPLRLHGGALKFAGLAAGLALVILWAYFGTERTVSAQELMSRAQAAEAGRMRGHSGCVIHRKLRLGRTGTIEFQTAAGRSEFATVAADAVWPEVERILRLNGMDRPLSAAAFERWRNLIPKKSETVKRTSVEGAEAFAIETAAAPPHRTDSIVSSRLVVRAQDWQAVEQNLEVQTARNVVRYDLREVAFDVRLPELARRKAVPVLPRRLLIPAPPQLEPDWNAFPLPVIPGDLETVEMQARYALHSLGACLGEPIEVAREGAGRIAVRGMVETAERKEEILLAMAPTPLVIAEIRTKEEMLAKGAPLPQTAESRPGGPLVSVMPVQKELEAYFKARMDASAVADAIAEFTNQAISLAQAFMADSWALRHLEQAYPSARAAALHPASRRLLDGMLGDHAVRLRAQAAEFRRVYEPFLSSIAAAPPRDPGPATLFEAARQAEQDTLALFAGNDERHPVPEAAARLLVGLKSLEAQSNGLAQRLNRELPALTVVGSPATPGK